jgi:hypothetical protein
MKIGKRYDNKKPVGSRRELFALKEQRKTAKAKSNNPLHSGSSVRKDRLWIILSFIHPHALCSERTPRSRPEDMSGSSAETEF